MKLFIALSVLVSVVYTSASSLLSPRIITAESPILSQYHSQDSLGQYTYGYNGGSSAKIETKTLDGVTRGSYSYFDADGRLQTVEYTADPINGFRAAATNLPQAPLQSSIPEPVRDTIEVQQAKAEHIRVFNEAVIRARADEVREEETKKARTQKSQQLVSLEEMMKPTNSFVYTINTPIDTTRPVNTWTTTTTGTKSQKLIADPTTTYSIRFGADEPRDTPEVTLAKMAHLKAVEDQKAIIASATK